MNVLLDVDMIMIDVLNYKNNISNNNHICNDICTRYAIEQNTTPDEIYNNIKEYGITGDEKYLYNYFSNIVYNTYAKDFTKVISLIKNFSKGWKVNNLYIISHTKRGFKCYNTKLSYLNKFLNENKDLYRNSYIIFTEEIGDKLEFIKNSNIKFDLIIDDNYREYNDKSKNSIKMLKDTIFCIPRRIPWRDKYIEELNEYSVLIY